MLGNVLDQWVNLPEEAMSKSILEPRNLDPGVHATSRVMNLSPKATSSPLDVTCFNKTLDKPSWSQERREKVLASSHS